MVGSVPSLANTSFTTVTGSVVSPPPVSPPPEPPSSPGVNSILTLLISIPLSLIVNGSDPTELDEPNAPEDEPIANMPKLKDSGARSIDEWIAPPNSA